MHTLSKYNIKYLCLTFVLLVLVSCANPWDKRQDEAANATATANLNEAISSTPELTKFEELLVQTGYDKIIAASKTFTVFAPSNTALAQIDPAILSNAVLLKQFVENHIAVTSYSSVRATETEKIKMLSGKYLEFIGKDVIGEATITTADKGATNGVFHVINKVLAPKLNIWEYLQTRKDSSQMARALIDLYSTSVSQNQKLYNIGNENNNYTLFLMEDAGYTNEFDKLSPYLMNVSASEAKTNTDLYVIRDLIFPSAYSLSQLPTSLVSPYGVKVPIDKTLIVGDPIVLSNGIVYIMKKVDVALVDRIQATVIEGENPTSSTDPSKVSYRVDPTFKSMIVSNTNPNFLVHYKNNFFFSTKYKIYAVVPYFSDVVTVVTTATPNTTTYAPNFKQLLVLGLAFNTDGTLNLAGSIKQITFPAVSTVFTVPYPAKFNPTQKNTDELYLGEYTFDNATSSNNLSLVSTGTASKDYPFTGGMFLDYLKFVPVLK